MKALTLALLAGGALLLFASVPLLFSILSLLHTGVVRRVWFALTGFVAIFLTIYLSLIWQFQTGGTVGSELVIAVLLFFGGAFVLGVTLLSRQTVIDVRRIATLERDAFVDPLTGLLNRRSLTERLDSEVALARRQGLTLSAVMIDVDHFKRVNDLCGHARGDEVLRALGRIVGTGCRSGDIALRYGGDEILILAANTGAARSVDLAERLRREIATTDFRTGFPITVSIGIAALDEAITTAAELLAGADSALYDAKQAGRDTIRVAMSSFTRSREDHVCVAETLAPLGFH